MGNSLVFPDPLFNSVLTLYGYLVGSLDFNFLGKSGFSVMEPQQFIHLQSHCSNQVAKPPNHQTHGS